MAERARSSARHLAVEALVRIDEGAYANLVVPALLSRSRLTARDRGLVTELAYGTTRMRRACDFLVDPYLRKEPDAAARAALRVGAYQLAFMGLPPHSAVSTAVDAAPQWAHGLVNAVLRKVSGTSLPPWPNTATELSYPDWIAARATADLGAEAGRATLEHMNRPPEVDTRPDGYVQDRASQWVAAYVGAGPGETVADLCAGPGGKATALAEAGPVLVAASDLRPHRAALVAANAARLGVGGTGRDRAGPLHVAVADAARPPWRAASFDRVLLDAPCSGLGVLARRPDARWRIDAEAPASLAALQRSLLREAAALVRPGGRLVYSVCTFTAEETIEVDAWASRQLTGFESTSEPAYGAAFEALPGPGSPWRSHGRGSLLLPQDAGTDGMFVLGLARTGR